MDGIGAPHPGHEVARFETRRLQSGHSVSLSLFLDSARTSTTAATIPPVQKTAPSANTISSGAPMLPTAEEYHARFKS